MFYTKIGKYLDVETFNVKLHRVWRLRSINSSLPTDSVYYTNMTKPLLILFTSLCKLVFVLKMTTMHIGFQMLYVF